MAQDELDTIQIIYSGGECGSLALFLNKKFNCDIYVITGTKTWDGKITSRGPYHYFVEHNGIYFDIYGWHKSFEDVNNNFVDFTPDCEIKFEKINPDQVKILPPTYNHSQEEVQEDWDKIIEKIWSGTYIDSRKH